MRNNYFKVILCIAIGIIINSCAQVRTYSTGLSNDAVLEFVGNPKKFKGGVDVEIDNNLKFKALVKKDYAEKPTGYVYTISKGTHSIVVSYNGTKLYSNQIFVSPQETKKIVLQWKKYYY